MSNIGYAVLESLRAGEWVFKRILSLYHSSLGNRCNAKDKNLATLQLSMLAFQNMHLKLNENDFEFLGPHNFESENEFQSLSQKIVEGGISVGFSNYEQDLIRETLIYISDKCPEVRAKVNQIFVAFMRIQNSAFCGASHPHSFGIYFVGDIFFKLSVQQRSISIVHELAHHELFLIQLIDRLVESKSDFNLVHAPLQNRPRPPIGRLHSLAALSRMLQYSEIFGADVLPIREKYIKNLALFESGELTSFGQELVHAIKISNKNLCA